MYFSMEYVLGYFGGRISDARKKCRIYIEEGVPMGRRPELVGGGLIRSLGGWEELKKIRLTGQDRIKSDHKEMAFFSILRYNATQQF